MAHDEDALMLVRCPGCSAQLRPSEVGTYPMHRLPAKNGWALPCGWVGKKLYPHTRAVRTGGL